MNTPEETNPEEIISVDEGTSPEADQYAYLRIDNPIRAYETTSMRRTPTSSFVIDADTLTEFAPRFSSYHVMDTSEASPSPVKISEELKIASQAAYQLYEQYSRQVPRHSMTNHENDFFNNITNKLTENHERILESECILPWSYLRGSVRNSLAREGRIQGVLADDNTIKHFYCSVCSRTTPTEFLFLQFGRLMCGEHVLSPDILSSCFNCGGVGHHKTIETIDGHEVKICSNCLNRRCKVCGGKIPNAFVLEGRCTNCLPYQESSGFYREVSRSFAWTQPYKIGEIVRSPRTFSAEIETVLSFPTDLNAFKTNIPTEAGIAKDSSINGNGLAVEVQTPRLAGEKGEECVSRIISAIRAAKGTVNKSCGLHVHIDGRGLLFADRAAYPKALVDFWRAHLVFEDVIKSFIPYQRRTNDYARSFGQIFSLMDIDTIRTMQDAERLWYRETMRESIQNAKGHHYHVSRYFGINLHPLFGDYHFEVRYHSGTLNKKKILEWANLHTLIADAAMEGKLPRSLMQEVAATTSVREKTKMLFAAIGLAPRSQQYFFGRQNKFEDKSLEEDNYN